MKKGWMLVLGAVLLLANLACRRSPQAGKAVLVVSAAASMADAMHDLQAAYASSHPDVTIQLNLGSSGALAQQIAKGAPVDLFISAGPDPMAAVVRSGLVNAPAVVNLVSNRLVLIRPATAAGGVGAWSDLARPDVARIAIGNPLHVPAGQYAKAVLTYLDLYDRITPKLVLGEDVRQVLAYVEAGEVQAGIVYATDAATSQRITVAAAAPPGSHPPIRYPMAVLKESHQAAAARGFATFLQSPAAHAIWTNYGFGEV